MSQKTEKNSFRFYLRSLLIGVVGLSFMLGNLPVYAQAQKTLIDLNTASEKDLESIKGVGPATAKKIIAGRPYSSLEDLKKAGLSDKTIESMKPLVKVGAPPVPLKPAAEAKPAASTAAEKGKPKVAVQAPSKLAPGQKVNLNTATKEQLEALPEIGPVKAQAIIDGRPYKKPEDIMKIKGIKEGIFNKIKDAITVQ